MTFRLAFVGDLSQQDPALLARALDAALGAADLVVQLGDIHGAPDDKAAYDVVLQRMRSSGKLVAVPGNHDAEDGRWDRFMVTPETAAAGAGMAKQWIALTHPELIVVGLDNSADRIDDKARDLLNQAHLEYERRLMVAASTTGAPPPPPVFVCLHKSLSPLVLPDGTESTHIISEGAPNADADWLKEWCRLHAATIACGHYHGSAILHAPYGTVLLEGRGGAAGPGNLGYTLVLVTPDGWTAHPVTV